MQAFGAPYAPSERDIPTHVAAYRVIRLLARGTTSDLCVAREEGPLGFARVVLLKILLPQFRDDDRAAQAFVGEAMAYTRLSHPAIARLYGFVADSHEFALVLEYVDGLPLNQLRATLHRRGERLSDQAATFIVCRLFGALAAAHSARDLVSGEAASIVHGDVNPSNIIVPWDGYAKLVDFGSSTISGAGSPWPPGGMGRTYIAPEQALGGPVTLRADIYSASLILWELLSGRRAVAPGRHSGRALLDAMAHPRIPALAALRPDLPKPLLDLVSRGIEVDPDRRDVFAEEACAILRASSDLRAARHSLVDALVATRLSSLEEDTPETTPDLPRYAPSGDSRRSSPAMTRLYAHASSTHTTDRPVAIPAPPPATDEAPPRPPWVSRFALSGPLASVGVGGIAVLIGVAWSLGPAPASRRSGAVAAGAAAPPAPTGAPRSDAGSAVVPAAAPLPTPTAPPPSAAPPMPRERDAVVSLDGKVIVPVERGGHRVWVDGRFVGQSPGAFRVACGTHSVQVGSRGRVQHIPVECGADVLVR